MDAYPTFALIVLKQCHLQSVTVWLRFDFCDWLKSLGAGIMASDLGLSSAQLSKALRAAGSIAQPDQPQLHGGGCGDGVATTAPAVPVS